MSGSSRDASLASSNKQVGVELISLEKSRSPRRKLWHKKRRESVEGTLLTEENAPQGLLARDFSESKKWVILNVIAFLQISMNLNASIFGSANHALRGKWKISELRCRMFQGFFLIAYAFGCELWAPWSEESGRWVSLQWSLGLVNVWQIPQLMVLALCPPRMGEVVTGVVLPCRILGGLSSAGGSVTLGVVADMWDKDHQRGPMAYLVYASVMGSIVGPVIGGFLESNGPAYTIVLTQLVLGIIAQLLQWFTPETRSSVLLTREARRMRSEENAQVWSEAELNELSWTQGVYWKRVINTWSRPFMMFLTEPIVLCLALISGYSDALIFTYLEALPMVMDQWSFVAWQKGLCFVSIGLGYGLGWIIWKCDNSYWSKGTRARELNQKPELRLRWLLWTAPFLFIAMYVFAWTATGPPHHWIAPQIPLVVVGIANYAIYGSTVDYMVAAYDQKYSASATGGNGFARDFLAGVSAFYAKSLYSKVGSAGLHLQLGSTIIASLAVPLIIPIFVFYFYGSWFRARSKYAKQVQQEREDADTLPTSH